MKKNSKKSVENNLKDAIKTTVENVEVVEKPKFRKMVQICINSGMLKMETPKAQLICIVDTEGNEINIWLAKSLIHVVVDGDDPSCATCSMPAWLYYKSGLKSHFLVQQWTSVAI